MACITPNNSPRLYQKSVQTAYNNAEQAFVADGTTLAVIGTLACDNGCSVVTGNDGFTIRNSGVYRISYDVTFTATGAGVATLGLYNGSSAMPCATAGVTTTANGVDSLHAETTVEFKTCCAVTPVISAKMGGVAGTVTHVNASVTRIS